MSRKIKLGNGSEVFACCGGVTFHVGSWHPEMEAEQAERHRRVNEYRAEQERLRDGLVGKTVRNVTVADGYSVMVTFEDGTHLLARLAGGELDGHFDPPANRSLSVVVGSPEKPAR